MLNQFPQLAVEGIVLACYERLGGLVFSLSEELVVLLLAVVFKSELAAVCLLVVLENTPEVHLAASYRPRGQVPRILIVQVVVGQHGSQIGVSRLLDSVDHLFISLKAEVHAGLERLPLHDGFRCELRVAL